MFSVAGIAATRSSSSPSSAIAAKASSTAAPPDMSIFISCMPAEGLIEIPPLSKVTALPTSPTRGPQPPPRVAQRDQPRLDLAAGGDGDEAAHAARGDRLAVEHLDLDGFVARGDLAGALGERLRGELVRGQVLQLAGAVGRLGADERDRRLGPHALDVLVRGDQQQTLEPGGGGSLGSPRAVAVEAVGGEHRALDERGRSLGGVAARPAEPRRSRSPRAPRRASPPAPRRRGAARRRRRSRCAEADREHPRGPLAGGSAPALEGGPRVVGSGRRADLRRELARPRRGRSRPGRRRARRAAPIRPRAPPAASL